MLCYIFKNMGHSLVLLLKHLCDKTYYTNDVKLNNVLLQNTIKQ